MTENVTRIKTFVASPGDVNTERKKGKKVIEELNRTICQSKNIHLEFVGWENVIPDIGKHPQKTIDEQIGPYDIFIGIMWKRFGHPTMGAGSGTEHEFNVAYKKRKKFGKPRILFYFSQKPYTPKTSNETEQWGKVIKFKKKVQKVGLTKDYKNPNYFERIIREHLTKIILAWDNEESKNNRENMSPSYPYLDGQTLMDWNRGKIEEQRISTIDYDWIMKHRDLDYSDPNRILEDKCAPSIDRLCEMANKNEIYLFTKLLTNIENRWKEINHDLDAEDNIKPVTSFFLEHYRTLLNFIFNHNIFNEIYTQTIKSLERVTVDLVSLKNVNNNYKIEELVYFNNFISEYINRILKDRERNVNIRILIDFITKLNIHAIRNEIYTFVLLFPIDNILNEYIENKNDDIKYFSLQLVKICKENIDYNKKTNVEFILDNLIKALEGSRGIFEWYIVKDLFRCVILIWIHIQFTKKTKMYDLIKLPHNLIREKDSFISLKMAFEDIEKYEKDDNRLKIIKSIKHKIYKSKTNAHRTQGGKTLQPKFLRSQETFKSKVFISYSSKDKSFVDQLASDLKKSGLKIWLDMSEIKVGDSIVQKINKGLSESDYFAIVISPNSIESPWVMEEFNSAMMSIIKQEKILLPILLKGCEIPPMLAHRRYADFRFEYQKGLDGLFEVLRQEQEDVSDKITLQKLKEPCVIFLMTGGELRKLLNERLQLREIKEICFDLEEPDYENLPGETKNEKILDLLIYFKNRKQMNRLLNWLKENRSDLCEWT